MKNEFHFYCWDCDTEIELKDKTLMKCPNCLSYKVIPKMGLKKCNPRYCDAGKSALFHEKRPKGFPKKGDCAHLVIRDDKKYCVD